MDDPEASGAAPTVPDARRLLRRGLAAEGSSAHASRQIGRFALIRKLGEGGMGVVHVGYDEALDRKVAVKVLHRGAAAASRWLLREAQALAKLSHPNVVPVYEVGEHDGRVFLAMEYVEGRTLRAHLGEEERPMDEVLRVFLQAGRGLAAAHRAGLVHRDFKPDNVLVGDDGRARVVDFGIAVLADRDKPSPDAAGSLSSRPIGASPSALITPLTDADALMGTPSFMSPEQFLGQPATPASDQFGFCAALYRAAYGQAPFEGEDLIDLARSVVDGALRPAPAKSTAPPWLGAMLARGLSARPEDRYPTLEALLDDIESRIPRSPDLDASITRRERRIVLAIMLAYAVGVATYIQVAGPSAHDTAWKLVGFGCALQLVAVLSVAVLWRRLRQNQQGRYIARVLVYLPAVLIAHRLIAAKLGTPASHVLIVDTFLLAVIVGGGSLVQDIRFGYAAAPCLALAVLGAFRPELAALLFTFAALLSVGMSVYVSERQR